jgi:hypothetical protein
MDGEIQIIANNDAASLGDFGASAPWRAIRAADGALVSPGTAGTLKYDAVDATNGGAFQLDDVVDISTAPNDSYRYMPFASVSADAGVSVPPIVRSLGLAPGSLALLGGMWVRNHGERIALRGGYWGYGPSAGLGALSLSVAPSFADWYIGARLAKV